MAQYPGVTAAESGYTGGHTNNPSYEQVCSGQTGHTEAVKVTFDAKKTSYKDLVKHFLKRHASSGSGSAQSVGQYGTAIFYENDAQAKLAAQAIAEFEAQFKHTASIAVKPAVHFWRAEEYHQKYYEKHGLGFCRSRK